MSHKVAFLGLGVMGYPIAGHLQNKGYDVVVYNRTPSKAQSWQAEYGGKIATSPAEAAKDADIVISCVSDDNALKQVATGSDGAFPVMKRGGLFIDHTTASATISRELHAQGRTYGIDFLDAPVSGGKEGARQGRLSIMVGGDKAVYERAQPVFQAYAAKAVYVGGSGSGQLTKMTNQIMVAGITQAVAEAMRFMEKTGLDIPLAMSVLLESSGYSRLLEHRASSMLSRQFDSGFALSLLLKDVTLVEEEASRCGLDLPLTKMIQEICRSMQANGLGNQDITALISRL
jgi:3-hydroxyisobutyrate dehydrogenase